MTTIGLAGAGTIGSGLIRLLNSSPAARQLRLKTLLVRDASKPRPGLPKTVKITEHLDDLVGDPEIDVVVEVVGGVEGAYSVVSRALAAGKSVVTANKNLLAERGPELFALAARHKVALGLEASVCGGIPIIRLLQEALRADRIDTIEGIVNGTTNYLLTRMSEERASYEVCLADAQKLGFAEPDPDYDVSGKDAVCKAGILATLAFGGYVDFRQIPTSGIETLALEDVRQAEAMGYRIKLVASARRSAEGFDAQVGPVLLPLGHPLASIRMEYNAVLVESDGLVKTLASGKGAGAAPTSISLLADLLDIAEGRARIPGPDHPFLGKPLVPGNQGSSRYYLRLSVPDRSGILAQVAGLFADQDISIASVLQPEVADAAGSPLVPLILTTHATTRTRLDAVLASLDDGWGRSVVLRISGGLMEVITSFHGIEETLKEPPAGAELLVGKKNARTAALEALARVGKVSVREATDAELTKLANGREQRGAVLLLPEGRKTRETTLEAFLETFDSDKGLVVLLDGVTDPQNYGAILRSADQFAADLVVIPSRRSASDTPAVSGASAGAVAWVPHAVVPNLTRALGYLKEAGFWIYGSDMDGTTVGDAKLTGRVALVLGSEGKGLSRLVRDTCDAVVSIPTRGKLDSLNVSVSAGILMYETRRQQN